MMKRENSSSSASTCSSERAALEARYKGVRKRKWGKYVSEIRLPNSRERIWLGSYDSAEKAARAFDAAMYCLRGRKAAGRLNFPHQVPDIQLPRAGVDPPMSHAEIQMAATKFAHADHPMTPPKSATASTKAQKDPLLVPSSPAATAGTMSDGSYSDEGSMLTPDMLLDEELGNMDWSFMDMLAPPEDLVGEFAGVSCDDVFRNFDFFSPPLPPPPAPAAVDEGEYLQPSFLWDF